MKRTHAIALLVVLLTLLLTLLACQQQAQRAQQPETPQEGGETMAEFKLTSSAFGDGERIPDKYTCVGEDVSPPLKWEGAPEGTKTFALIVEDPDAPGGTFIHWVLFNIPGTLTELPEGVEPLEKLQNGAIHGVNDFQRLGYRGPCPPPGKPHRYFFVLKALDRELSLGPGVTKQRLELEIEKIGGPLAETKLMGTYSR
jgi:hypothetical protein